VCRTPWPTLLAGRPQVGWARLQELREYIAFFRQSGKFSMAFMTTGAEKEYYLASACEARAAPVPEGPAEPALRSRGPGPRARPAPRAGRPVRFNGSAVPARHAHWASPADCA
jgi:hypothetical protein